MEVDSLLTEDKSEVKYQSFLFYNHYCPIKRFKTKIKDFSMQKHHRNDRFDNQSSQKSIFPKPIESK